MSQEKIIDKIAKLIAMAESAKKVGNTEEAETFSAKVTELLLIHNLDMHRVRMAAAAKSDQFAEWGVYGEDISHRDTLAGDRWQKDLIKMLCRHNMTGVIFNTYNNVRTFRVYGEMSNVDTTVWLFNWLSTNLLILSRQSRAALSAEDFAKQCRHTYMKNFLLGAIHAIDARLTKQTEEHKMSAGIFEMIKHNRFALDLFTKKQWPESFTSKTRSLNTDDGLGYDDGKKVGSEMDLGDGKKLTAAKEKVASKIKLLK